MKTARILAGSLFVSAATCQTPAASGPATPAVPAELAAPAGVEPVLRLYAWGTQNYKCTAGSDGAAQWKLVAPDAELHTSAERSSSLAGTHGAGPSWTLSDGSGVVGDGAQAKRAPSPEAGSIPWLLVPCKDNGRSGSLQGVTFVQRLDTHGGAAPATGCDPASVGAETKVAYSATYVFLRAR
ncbi:MAG TPA: DUF3455 domain-containing protein [Myxococcaceae bacterium]|nr:DUF3455 domain-containing protein [Myxococcaceae bacterium]